MYIATIAHNIIRYTCKLYFSNIVIRGVMMPKKLTQPFVSLLVYVSFLESPQLVVAAGSSVA